MVCNLPHNFFASSLHQGKRSSLYNSHCVRSTSPLICHMGSLHMLFLLLPTTVASYIFSFLASLDLILI